MRLSPIINESRNVVDYDRPTTIARYLDYLKDQEKNLLWLAYAEDMSHKEMAKVLNVGQSSIKVLLFRARKRFMQVMKQLEIKPSQL